MFSGEWQDNEDFDPYDNKVIFSPCLLQKAGDTSH